MNILIFSWRGPGHPNGGGAEISTHEHAKSWVRAGHNVTLFTSRYPGGKKEEIVDGVKVIRSGAQFFGVHWEAFKWYCFGDHPKFDLVIDQFHGIPFFTPFYVKAKKMAFIHEVTKEVWNFNQFPFPFNLLISLIGNLSEPLIFKFYKKVPFMTVSDSTKNDLIAWGIESRNVAVIHNGVNIPASAKQFQKEKIKTLIYLGALAKDKGVEEALKIFSILSKQSLRPDGFKNTEAWQFWLVGKSDPAYLLKLKNETKKLQIERQVKFWGYVSEQKKYELLAKAHILINPSVREGWGLVVIEAARMGTPTVGFDVPGLRDSVVNGKTGILCVPSSGNMAEEVKELLKDNKKYAKISRNAIEWSMKFSWKNSAKLSLKLLSEIQLEFENDNY